MSLSGGLVVLGVLFSALAALAAYLITYAEYVRHYPDSQRPRRMALEAAIVAFVAFLVLGLGAGVCLVRFSVP